MFIDIGFLCSYYTSSKSNWEKVSVGSPIDGDSSFERFSFHTDKEINPFIVFELPESLIVSKVVLNLRDKYKSKCFPIKITVEKINSLLEEYVVPEGYEKASYVFELEAETRSIKFESVGNKALDFSSVNIFAAYSDFCGFFEKIRPKNIVYGHTSFYGLGGKLSVLATSLGVVGSSTNYNHAFCDESLKGLVSFPMPYNREKNTVLKDFINRYASEALKSYIHCGKYISEKNIGQYLPTIQKSREMQRFAFISRDSLDFFRNKDESFFKVHQRLYKRVVPSLGVLNKLKELCKDFSKFQGKKSIGLHFRHGNGELYKKQAQDKNVWGVKPPEFERFFEIIYKILENDSSVAVLYIASDSPAVLNQFREKFKNKLQVEFISKTNQPVGSGCNHNDKIFNKHLVRNQINVFEDDVVSYSEILFLSECDYIIGGESYFFNAVIGYGNHSDDNIFKIENKDRYSILHSSFVPFIELSDEPFYAEFFRHIKYLDGIFIQKNANSVIVNYFDIALDSASSFETLKLDKITNGLKKYRGY